jgi:hypothetical protein
MVCANLQNGIKSSIDDKFLFFATNFSDQQDPSYDVFLVLDRVTDEDFYLSLYLLRAVPSVATDFYVTLRFLIAYEKDCPNYEKGNYIGNTKF